MGLLTSMKEFAIDFFSSYAPAPRFKEKVIVLNHAVSFRAEDKGDEPRLITNVQLTTPGLIERYGKDLEIESSKLYNGTKIGATITLILEVNPEYDENVLGSQKLRLYIP